jgi:hypothetical protein
MSGLWRNLFWKEKRDFYAERKLREVCCHDTKTSELWVEPGTVTTRYFYYQFINSPGHSAFALFAFTG